MNILILGTGKGSWAIRGIQLGAALGARVLSDPTEADVKWADVVVLVKRAGLKWSKYVHSLGKPIVWDALDVWQQPRDHRFTEQQACAWLKSQIAAIRPDVTIGATEAMARVVKGVYLPHHGWPGLKPTPPRAEVRIVGYEGNPTYLGRWGTAIQQACLARGWTFVINPPALSEVDLLVAFRDGQWDGWICRAWKSGVKFVNAICAGRPIITQPCAAVDELEPIGSTIGDPAYLESALDHWARQSARQEAVDVSLKRAADFSVQFIADRYQKILAQQVRACVS